jgi:hypothetical protein
MIELKGSYYQSDGKKALPVLVQFDGAFLHVWHLADPFYRLISSDDFSIASSGNGRPGIIKATSNNIRIETDDLQSLQKLKTRSDRLRRVKTRKAIKIPMIIITAALVCLFLGMWLVRQSGSM